MELSEVYGREFQDLWVEDRLNSTGVGGGGGGGQSALLLSESMVVIAAAAVLRERGFEVTRVISTVGVFHGG